MAIAILAVTSAILLIICCILAAMLVFHRAKAKKEMAKTSLFLSTVAHDIRSPLTNVKGFADALLSGDINGEKKEQALAVISLEASRLASLTERLCENDDNIVQNPTVFGICELLRSIFLSLERKASAKDINISYSFADDDEIYVKADRALIHEALYNICDNAIKYCSKKDIYVNVAVSDGKAEISVSNSTDDTSFSDYFTAGSRGNSSEKGTGLGLYISEKLIRSCKSELLVKKENSKVSFCFQLPHVGEEE